MGSGLVRWVMVLLDGYALVRWAMALLGGPCMLLVGWVVSLSGGSGLRAC